MKFRLSNFQIQQFKLSTKFLKYHFSIDVNSDIVQNLSIKILQIV